MALDTWLHESRGIEVLYEAGGVYTTKPVCKFTSNVRPFEFGEHVATCPSCGMRFADVDGAAVDNLYIHIIGSDDDLRSRVESGEEALPTICSAKRAVTC